MAALVDPLELGDVALCVDALVSTSGKTACKFITFGVKDRVLGDYKRFSQVPSARRLVLRYFSPYLLLFLLGGLLNVCITIEL